MFLYVILKQNPDIPFHSVSGYFFPFYSQFPLHDDACKSIMKCGLTVLFLLHALSLFICRWFRLLSLLFYFNNFVASFYYFCTGRPCAYFNISLFTFFHIIFEITAICLSRLATPANGTFFPLLDCLCDCSCMELDETQECYKAFLREY